MSKLTERSIRLREILKTRLELKKVTYTALADKIGVSVPTIKRWMTKDDFPMEALDSILQEVALSWQDVIGMLDKKEVMRQPISAKHETFLAGHPQEALVFLYLSVQYQYAEIKQELNLRDRELESILFKLDKNDFIAYNGKDDIRILIRIPFRFSDKGSFSKKYFSRASKLIFDNLVATFPGFSTVFEPSPPMIRVGEMYLTEKSLVRFKADISELVDKYRETCRLELSFKRRDELVPVGFLIALDKFPLWKKVLWEE